MVENIYLAHHGVKGMKWGVRHDRELVGNKKTRKGLSDRQKKVLKIGAIVVGTALAAYGTYILSDNIVKYHRVGKRATQDLLKKTEAGAKNSARALLRSDVELSKRFKSPLSRDEIASKYKKYTREIFDERKKNIPKQVKEIRKDAMKSYKMDRSDKIDRILHPNRVRFSNKRLAYYDKYLYRK